MFPAPHECCLHVYLTQTKWERAAKRAVNRDAAAAATIPRPPAPPPALVGVVVVAGAGEGQLKQDRLQGMLP